MKKPRFSLLTNKENKSFMEEFKKNLNAKNAKEKKVRVIGRLTLPLSKNIK